MEASVSVPLSKLYKSRAFSNKKSKQYNVDAKETFSNISINLFKNMIHQEMKDTCESRISTEFHKFPL